ncbi:MAG: TPM domain-containing protein [Polaromonas sp.]|nr:TPM domain-containing protein [Polaromonas sp.]
MADRALGAVAAGWVCRCLCLLASGWLALPAPAQTLHPVPPLSARVIDSTGTLDATQIQALEAKLAAFEKARGTQVVVLMVPTTLPEDITDYAQRVGDAWKIGRKDVGDGVLLVVAKNDRKVRIATAKTLEGALPDLAARQIIDRAITPRFRQGDFAGGLDAAADQIMARITGENLPLPDAAERANASGKPAAPGFQWTDLAVFLFFAVLIGGRLLAGLLGRKFGSLATGAAVGVVAWFFTASLVVAGIATVVAMLFALIASLAPAGRGRSSGIPGWGGSAGHGGWGGGGFSSGGGGNFGGGGASGNW